jgi:hypothetical protein
LHQLAVLDAAVSDTVAGVKVSSLLGPVTLERMLVEVGRAVGHVHLLLHGRHQCVWQVCSWMQLRSQPPPIIVVDA